MSLFSIDESKCKRDGVCVADCPLQLIQITGEDFPSPIEGAEQFCINCGHCVAICPHGALALKTMNPEECFPVTKEALPTPDQAKLLLTARRSIRTYKKQPVDRKVLNELIKIACYAPSGHNVQPVNWLVIEDPGEVQRLAGLVVDWMRFMMEAQPELARSFHFERVSKAWDIGLDNVCRSAPHIIVTHAPKENPLAQTSCTIALTYLELAAFGLGLGACWAGYFHLASLFYPPMSQALNLPEGHQCFGAMMVGYPQYHYHRVPKRNEAAITWR